MDRHGGGLTVKRHAETVEIGRTEFGRLNALLRETNLDYSLHGVGNGETFLSLPAEFGNGFRAEVRVNAVPLDRERERLGRLYTEMVLLTPSGTQLTFTEPVWGEISEDEEWELRTGTDIYSVRLKVSEFEI
jgi:hypothetical protein